MSRRIIRGAPLYLLCLFLTLLSVHPSVWAGGGSVFAVGELLSSGLISAQAELAPERPRPGSNRPVFVPNTPAKAAVIPEPPPFPIKEDSQAMTWAMGTVAAIALIMGYLIFKMVRGDSSNRRKTQKGAKGRAGSDRSDGWGGAGERRGERDPTVIHTTLGPTTPGENTLSRTTMGRTTQTQDEKLPPITVIQSQWQDIQGNSQQQEPTLNLGSIEIDAQLKQSVEKAGYNPFYTTREDGIEVSEMGGAGDVPEAEVLMRMGFHDQAMQVLERMITDLEHPQPKIWLMLFELYKKTGLQEKYEDLGKGFNTYFNAVAPSWDTTSPEMTKSLEDYPGVVNKVVRLWGLQGCRMYLETLLYDNRSGTRQGFSLMAYDDILFLLDLIQTVKEIGDGPAL